MGGGGRDGAERSAGGAAPATQTGALEGAGVTIDHAGRELGGADEFGAWQDAETLKEVSGEGATELARRNATLRETRSKDKDRFDENVLRFRKIGETWYNRVGQFWVDERIDDKTHMTVIKYGSDAWFALVDRLPDLRAALAADKNMAVMVKDGFAVIVAENEGLEKLDDAALKAAGIP